MSKEPTLRQTSPQEMLTEAANRMRQAQANFEARARLQQQEPPPGDPVTIALRAAKSEYDGLQARLRSWMPEVGETEPVEPVQVKCSCPGSNHDRLCLGCGMRGCATCMPRTEGGADPRCAGPVWADGETRTAPIRNPTFQGW